jgi:hypothetical protein
VEDLHNLMGTNRFARRAECESFVEDRVLPRS